MVHIPTHDSQPCVTRFFVEKHGKGPCDARLFSPMRRFLKQACMVPGSFAESEHDIVKCLQHAAAQETAAIPGGPTWAIKVPYLPEKRPPTKTLSMLNCKINRSYCFQTVLSKRQKAGL